MRKLKCMVLMVLLAVQSLNSGYLLFAQDLSYESDNELADKKPNFTIEDICHYIFSDLNIKWNYTNLEDLFEDLKFTDDYIIKERIERNTIQTGEGFFHVSDIEYGQYKITIFAFSNHSDYIDNPRIYWLKCIEIEINDKNYLDLFPYTNMEGYFNDTGFGKIYEMNQGKDNIFYGMRYGDDRFGYCDLIFSNGLVKSIKILGYTP